MSEIFPIPMPGAPHASHSSLCSHFSTPNSSSPQNVAGRGSFLQNVAGQKLIKPLSLLGCCGFAATKNKCCGSGPQKDPMFAALLRVLRVQRGGMYVYRPRPRYPVVTLPRPTLNPNPNLNPPVRTDAL